MKTMIGAAGLLAGLISAAAAQESMEANFEKKLKAPFLSKAAWITDYEKALGESKATGKPIFAYFTRSYAN